MSRRSRARAVSTVVPLVVTASIIGVLAVVQFRWLAELADLTRLRMEQAMRGAVNTVAAGVTLDVGRLAAGVAQAGSSPGAVNESWSRWRSSTPGLAGLYPEAGAGLSSALRPDSAFVADSLLPLLHRGISALAGIEVVLELVRSDASGVGRAVARSGEIPGNPPDVIVPLGLDGGSSVFVFMGETGEPAELTSAAAGLAWSAAPGAAPVAPRTPDPGWSLRAWHEAGSLAEAAERIRRRNLLTALGLIGVLVASAALTVAAYRRNERLAADRATILAGISHEIRTPVAVIRSAADNLGGGVVSEPEQVREYGRLIEAQVRRLEDNVEGALAFARAAVPRSAHREVVSLRELALEVVRSSEAPERAHVADGPDANCRADRQALFMAIRNLVGNALAYSPAAAEVLVDVTVEGSGAAIRVMDRGPGVPLEDRATMFEPFVRGRGADLIRRAGLGLGLALADRVAALHGGRLHHEDRPGGGSVFTLWIPVG